MEPDSDSGNVPEPEVFTAAELEPDSNSADGHKSESYATTGLEPDSGSAVVPDPESSSANGRKSESCSVTGMESDSDSVDGSEADEGRSPTCKSLSSQNILAYKQSTMLNLNITVSSRYAPVPVNWVIDENFFKNLCPNVSTIFLTNKARFFYLDVRTCKFDYFIIKICFFGDNGVL